MSVRNLDLPGGENVGLGSSESSSADSSSSSSRNSNAMARDPAAHRRRRRHRPQYHADPAVPRSRRRRRHTTPRYNPALDSSSDDEGDSESLGNSRGEDEDENDNSSNQGVRLMGPEEQKQAAARDQQLSSFEVVTLSVDKGIVFPGDINEDIIKQAYEHEADPLRNEVSSGRVGAITKDYCYMCEAIDLGGKNVHLDRINDLANTVTIKSTDHVVNQIYAYYCETVGRRSRRKRMGKLMIYTHYFIDVPNDLWLAKQDVQRTSEMENIALNSICHRDVDGTNQRLVMENFKTYVKLAAMARSARDRYFKLVSTHSSGRRH